MLLLTLTMILRMIGLDVTGIMWIFFILSLRRESGHLKGHLSWRATLKSTLTISAVVLPARLSLTSKWTPPARLAVTGMSCSLSAAVL